MSNLMDMLKKENISCIIQQQDILYRYVSQGIAPILQALEEKQLAGAMIADKVIGKAAAMMMVYGGVKEIETILISEPACQFLASHNIKFTYETLVPYIINRTNDGMCPMEETVLHMNDMENAYIALTTKLAQLKKMPKN